MNYTPMDGGWVGRTTVESLLDGIYIVRVASEDHSTARRWAVSVEEARLSRVVDAELLPDADMDTRACVLAYWKHRNLPK